MRGHAIPCRVLKSINATWWGRVKGTGRDRWERRWRSIRVSPRGRKVGITLSGRQV